MRDAAAVAGVGGAERRPWERGACSRVSANLPEVVAINGSNGVGQCTGTKTEAKRFVNDCILLELLGHKAHGRACKTKKLTTQSPIHALHTNWRWQADPYETS